MVNNHPNRLSLLAVGGKVSIAVQNQGDHCIIAKSQDEEKIISQFNQTLLGVLTAQDRVTAGDCEQFAWSNGFEQLKENIEVWLGIKL